MIVGIMIIKILKDVAIILTIGAIVINDTALENYFESHTTSIRIWSFDVDCLGNESSLYDCDYGNPKSLNNYDNYYFATEYSNGIGIINIKCFSKELIFV